jgi:D-threo-aldose 1-dehydrogenase
MFGHHIPDDLWPALVERGLLDEDVPLPLTTRLAANEAARQAASGPAE